MALRGQAFETMMLVISVIVALAILGVLTGIIGNLNFGPSNSPQEAMHDELKKVATSGYGFSEPIKINIKKGTKIASKGILKNDLPEVNSDFVRFCVSSTVGEGFTAAQVTAPAPSTTCSNVCNVGGLDFGPSTQDLAAFFVVCGDANVGLRGGYKIAIASTAKEASRLCTVPTTTC